MSAFHSVYLHNECLEPGNGRGTNAPSLVVQIRCVVMPTNPSGLGLHNVFCPASPVHDQKRVHVRYLEKRKITFTLLNKTDFSGGRVHNTTADSEFFIGPGEWKAEERCGRHV